MKPVLYYDASCPMCSAFRKRIESDIGPGMIDFKPAPAEAKSFRYVRSTGVVTVGKDALKALLQDFPGIGGALNILPEKWKEQVIGATVRAAGALRTAMQQFQARPGTGDKPGGCGCGK